MRNHCRRKLNFVADALGPAKSVLRFNKFSEDDDVYDVCNCTILTSDHADITTYFPLALHALVKIASRRIAHDRWSVDTPPIRAPVTNGSVKSEFDKVVGQTVGGPAFVGRSRVPLCGRCAGSSEKVD